MRIGYGILAFAIFGSTPRSEQKDYEQALVEYRKQHPHEKFSGQTPGEYMLRVNRQPLSGSQSRNTGWLRAQDNFYRWYERHLLTGYNLPEPFLQAIDEALEALPPRYKEVLQMRFGLVDGEERTLEEVGRKIENMKTGRKGVVRERARQIGARALYKLRHSQASRKIKASLTDKGLRYLFGFESPDEEHLWFYSPFSGET